MFPDPDGVGLRERLLARHGTRSLVRAYGISVVVVVAIAALTAIIALDGGGHAPQRGNPRARESGVTGVAAAYGYPSSCLSVTFSTLDRAFARADFDHASQCGRYTGYSTAIFQRRNQEWRPVLEALGYRCPVARIPPGVQRELGVCP